MIAEQRLQTEIDESRKWLDTELGTDYSVQVYGKEARELHKEAMICSITQTLRHRNP